MASWAEMELLSALPIILPKAVILGVPLARLLFLGIATVVGIGVALWLRRFIIKTEERRKRHVERIQRFESVRTETPLADPAEQARERGIESIETRFTVIRRLVFPVFGLCWLLVVLGPFLHKIPAAFVSFLVGVITVVVGIAAKPFIENVIAGLVLSFSQPIRIGDTVRVDGRYGTVEDISLTFIVVKLWDWRRYIVPNQTMLQKAFLNYSIVDRYQWAYVEFWVSYEADLDIVREISNEAVMSCKHFAPHEPPAFWVMGMDKEGARCWAAGWANSPSGAWLLAHEIRTALCRALRKHGIKTHTTYHDARLQHRGSAPESD